MDQTESKNQVLCRNQQKCSDDSNLDCFMRLFAYRIYQISSKNKAKHAANFEVIATQFI